MQHLLAPRKEKKKKKKKKKEEEEEEEEEEGYFAQLGLRHRQVHRGAHSCCVAKRPGCGAGRF